MTKEKDLNLSSNPSEKDAELSVGTAGSGVETGPDPAGEKKGALKWRLLIPPVIVLAILGLYVIFTRQDDQSLEQILLITMDTSIDIRFTEGDLESRELESAVRSLVEELERTFSRTLEESDVSAVNRAAGAGPVAVSPETAYVASRALYYADLTSGSFDPTIAPLIDLWGFLNENYRLPDSEEIEAALPLVDYRRLIVDAGAAEIGLNEKWMGLELGGIAKGYIVDRLMELLVDSGVEHAFVNAGGDIAIHSTRPDGNPWRIGIANPRDRTALIAIMTASGGSVVTSGDYERGFEVDGVNYHHILDPKTGMPARGLSSVTVVAERAIDADALSTAIFVIGLEDGLELAESLAGVEVVIVTEELEIFYTSGLSGLLEIVE